jgi:hypothetical protein
MWVSKTVIKVEVLTVKYVETINSHIYYSMFIRYDISVLPDLKFM